MGMISNRLNPLKSVGESLQDKVRRAGGIAEFVRNNPLLARAVEIAFPAAIPVIEGLRAAGTAMALTKPAFAQVGRQLAANPALSPEELAKRAARSGRRSTQVLKSSTAV